MGRLIDVDKFLENVKKDREHEIYLHSWTADMVLERLDSWYAPTVEAIPKDQYEARLKADMVAILEDLDLQIDESAAYNLEVAKVQRLIRDRIDKLKENEDEYG